MVLTFSYKITGLCMKNLFISHEKSIFDFSREIKKLEIYN